MTTGSTACPAGYAQDSSVDQLSGIFLRSVEKSGPSLRVAPKRCVPRSEDMTEQERLAVESLRVNVVKLAMALIDTPFMYGVRAIALRIPQKEY